MNDGTDLRYGSSQRDKLQKLVKVWSQFLLWSFMPGRYPSSWLWCALHELHTIGRPWRVRPCMLHRPPRGLPGYCTGIRNLFCTWLWSLWPNVEKVVFSTGFPWIFDIVVSDKVLQSQVCIFFCKGFDHLQAGAFPCHLLPLISASYWQLQSFSFS